DAELLVEITAEEVLNEIAAARRAQTTARRGPILEDVPRLDRVEREQCVGLLAEARGRAVRRAVVRITTDAVRVETHSIVVVRIIGDVVQTAGIRERLPARLARAAALRRHLNDAVRRRRTVERRRRGSLQDFDALDVFLIDVVEAVDRLAADRETAGAHAVRV